MPDKLPPRPTWPKAHAYGAVLGEEYGTLLPFIRDNKPFVHQVHNETVENLKALAKFYDRRMVVTEWDSHMSQVEVLEC